MTDKEIAIELGEKLIRNTAQILAMSIQLDIFRDTLQQPAPWRQAVADSVRKSVSEAFDERLEEFRLAIGASKPEDVLRTLQEFLK